MPEVIKELSEVCVDKLTETEGKGLELMANITHPSQVELVLESYIYGPSGLRSRYVQERNEMSLRLSVSDHGKGRDGIEAIGKAPRISTDAGGNFGGLHD